MMTLIFFISLLTIFGLLFLLWLEFTNPELLESASAHGSSRQLQDLHGIYCHARAFTRCRLPIRPFST